MTFRTLFVETAQHAYPIYIGANLSDAPELLHQHIKGEQVLLVSHAQIAEHYAPPIVSALATKQLTQVLLPAGESNKTLAGVLPIYQSLIEHCHHRSSTLIALGGGLVGDMTGFAAATYQRGVNLIQMPTSLLAMVDSAVGGKTGVNHGAAKNVVGAFHQPQCVLIDVSTLKTLARREYVAGLAEVIKTAMIADEAFFDWLEQHWTEILTQQTDVLLTLVARCCDIKSSIVQLDEKDLTGQRAILNFGHTFGHAIEQATNYQTYLHGEAVAIGLMLATDLSVRLKLLPKSVLKRLKNLLTSASLPIQLSGSLDSDQLLHHMSTDKKNQDAGQVLILLQALGCAGLNKDVDRAVLTQVITDHIPL